MNKDNVLEEILLTSQSIAIYGMSTKSEKPAYFVPEYLLKQGYKVIPINPFANKILDLKSYSKLKDIPERIDVLEVFRPSDDVHDIVKEAIDRKKEKGDIKIIWLQEGIVDDKAKELAEGEGIVFVQDKCMLKEHERLMERERRK